tara:strand:+ start:7513 stop:8247 length:735 start_codon:yes stop_codon:yes gene_type:complete
MIIEICANSYQSAKNAQIAGANRIELCSELAVGGITPSYGLIKQVLDNISIPVHVLVRPRSGNFTYSKSEFEIMKKDIQLCKDLGCKGIVSGTLNPDQTIDIERTKQLVELSKPLNFTFHRAFDWTPNPLKALDTLIDLGVNSVLTSGQEKSAKAGINLLKQLKTHANNKITLLPGGGIHLKNAALFQKSGFKALHCSLTTFTTVNKTPNIAMNSSKHFSETHIATSDIKKIQQLIKILKDTRS